MVRADHFYPDFYPDFYPVCTENMSRVEVVRIKVNPCILKVAYCTSAASGLCGW